jgi:4'-phosphopantetheinyl transferase
MHEDSSFSAGREKEKLKYTDLYIKISREDKGEFYLGISILEVTDPEDLINNTDNFINVLHGKEITKLHSLAVLKRKFSYLLGRLVAKRALSILDSDIKLKDLFIDNGIFKQPLIEHQENFEVSISHSGNLGLGLAFPKFHPAAVDVEEIVPNRNAAIESCLTEAELKLINNFIDPNIAHFSLWTTKEALSKAIKCGLTVNFKVLEISKINRNDTVYVMEFTNFAQYKAISFTYKKHIISFVIPIKSQLDLKQFMNF